MARACMNRDLTTIFSSRSIRKWNTLWLCVRSMILFTNCTPIMLYASYFRVTQDPSAWLSIWRSAQAIASIYVSSLLCLYTFSWLGRVSWFGCSNNLPFLIMFISICCHQPISSLIIQPGNNMFSIAPIPVMHIMSLLLMHPLYGITPFFLI